MEFKKLIRILSMVAMAIWIFCLSFLVTQQIARRRMDSTTTTLPIITNTPVSGDSATQPNQQLQTPGIEANTTVPSQPAGIDVPQIQTPTNPGQPALSVPSTTAEIAITPLI